MFNQVINPGLKSRVLENRIGVRTPTLGTGGTLSSLKGGVSRPSMILFLGLFMLLKSTALQAEAPLVCFNFANPIHAPLKDFPKRGNRSAHITQSEFGKFPAKKGGVWGAARQQLPFSIEKIYSALLDHTLIKDPKKTQLRVFHQTRPGYADFHVVMVKALNLLFDIRWEEEWGYAVAEGTRDKPKKIVISYQKSNGTRYINRLCGSIVLEAIRPNVTEVYLYEEIQAFGRRSAKDTVAGHLGTLQTLENRLQALDQTERKKHP